MLQRLRDFSPLLSDMHIYKIVFDRKNRRSKEPLCCSRDICSKNGSMSQILLKLGLKWPLVKAFQLH